MLEAVDQALRVGCPTIWWPGWCGKKRTLGGTVRLTRALVPSMKEHRWGRIINIGSEAGMQPDQFIPHYNAAKAAVINLTKSLSKTCARDGMLVNTVSPGPVKTPLAAQFIAAQVKAQGETPQQAEQASCASSVPTSNWADSRRPKRWLQPPCIWLRRRLRLSRV